VVGRLAIAVASFIAWTKLFYIKPS